MDLGDSRWRSIKSVSRSEPSQGFLFHVEWNLTFFSVSAVPADHYTLFLHPLWAWSSFLCHPALRHAHSHLLRASAPTPSPERSRSFPFWLDLSPEVTFPDPCSVLPCSDSCEPWWQMFLSFYLLVHLSVSHPQPERSLCGHSHSVFYLCCLS